MSDRSKATDFWCFLWALTHPREWWRQYRWQSLQLDLAKTYRLLENLDVARKPTAMGSELRQVIQSWAATSVSYIKTPEIREAIVDAASRHPNLPRDTLQYFLNSGKGELLENPTVLRWIEEDPQVLNLFHASFIRHRNVPPTLLHFHMQNEDPWLAWEAETHTTVAVGTPICLEDVDTKVIALLPQQEWSDLGPLYELREYGLLSRTIPLPEVGSNPQFQKFATSVSPKAISYLLGRANGKRRFLKYLLKRHHQFKGLEGASEFELTYALIQHAEIPDVFLAYLAECEFPFVRLAVYEHPRTDQAIRECCRTTALRHAVDRRFSAYTQSPRARAPGQCPGDYLILRHSPATGDVNLTPALWRTIGRNVVQLGFLDRLIVALWLPANCMTPWAMDLRETLRQDPNIYVRAAARGEFAE